MGEMVGKSPIGWFRNFPVQKSGQPLTLSHPPPSKHNEIVPLRSAPRRINMITSSQLNAD
jgi:hypothetical protein